MVTGKPGRAASASAPPSNTPAPVVALTDLPRATAPSVQRRSTYPLATTRPLTPRLPGTASAPARPRTADDTAPPAAPLSRPVPDPAPGPRPVVPLAPTSAARPVARPVAVQRQAAPEAVPAPAPVVPVVAAPLRRSAAPHAPRAATTVTRTAVQRTAEPRTTATGSDSGSASPGQLDELARRLVTPLSRLLRAELRADRERVGRLRDHGR
ncbi:MULTISPECIES: hypothetical protein [Streptomyces]|uniref:hypothetical protein n=1 Tax=Streptomyces TaxID=1883 RepID=UPI0009400460|nr:MULTISPECIES: hypothetical protein [Streptomyces]MBX9421082.1 hypothetical protein [Streptomyces lateritius]